MIIVILSIIALVIFALFIYTVIAGNNKLKSEAEKMAELDEQEQYLTRLKK